MWWRNSELFFLLQGKKQDLADVLYLFLLPNASGFPSFNSFLHRLSLLGISRSRDLSRVIFCVCVCGAGGRAVLSEPSLPLPLSSAPCPDHISLLVSSGLFIVEWAILSGKEKLKPPPPQNRAQIAYNKPKVMGVLETNKQPDNSEKILLANFKALALLNFSILLDIDFGVWEPYIFGKCTNSFSLPVSQFIFPLCPEFLGITFHGVWEISWVWNWHEGCGSREGSRPGRSRRDI